MFDKHCSFPDCNGWRIQNSIYCVAHTCKFSPEKLDTIPKDIIACMEDDAYFKKWLGDIENWRTWQVALKALFNLEMTDSEVEVYKKITARTKLPGKPFREAYFICGRRSGKSMTAAMVCVYCAIIQKYPQLRKGERGEVVLLASDRVQCRVIMDYIKEILERPAFKDFVKNRRMMKETIELKNNITIRIATTNFRGLRGSTAVCVVCDELSYWRDENSAQPDVEVLRAIRPSQLLISNAILLGVSSPYLRSGVVFQAHEKYYGVDDADVLVVKGSTTTFNPTASVEDIEGEIERDGVNKAEYFAEFRQDLENFLPMELIQEAVVPGRTNLPYDPAINYYAFCDPSSGQQDSFTLSIAFKDVINNKIVIALAEEERPPFSPSNVIEKFSKILTAYGLKKVTGDRYAVGFVSEIFKKNGITYEPSKLTASELYLECQILFTTRQLELPDNKRMINQFQCLERKRRQGAKDSVSHPQFGSMHDDLCGSAAGAAVGVSLFTAATLAEAEKNLPHRASDFQGSRGDERRLNPYPKVLSEKEKEAAFHNWLRER